MIRGLNNSLKENIKHKCCRFEYKRKMKLVHLAEKKTILNSNYFQKKDQAIREEWMFELFKKGVALLNGIKEYSKLYTNT